MEACQPAGRCRSTQTGTDWGKVVTPERARWLLDNPFVNPYSNATVGDVRAASAPYMHTEAGWIVQVCVDL
jgi:hypothetical protein